jgi:hypothetical protein
MRDIVFHHILKEMQRSDDLTQGLGKPEALKHELR